MTSLTLGACTQQRRCWSAVGAEHQGVGGRRQRGPVRDRAAS